MRVALVGAGALGSVYGARLAQLASCDVRVVGRTSGETRVERVDSGEVLRWTPPAATASAPLDADAVLVVVRYEQLDDVPARVAGGAAPVVVLTPMLPQDHARLTAALPGRVVAAMPSVVAYRNDAGAVRYWLPKAATTFLESPASTEHARVVGELAKRLLRAEIAARVVPGVLERNAATTVSFIPLFMALDAAGGIDAVLRDEALLDLAIAAAEEGRELGRAIGNAEAWASTLLGFVGRRTLTIGAAIARRRSPEGCRYVEEHFGRKLHAQNVLMAERMVELAVAKGLRHDALTKLLSTLRAAA